MWHDGGDAQTDLREVIAAAEPDVSGDGRGKRRSESFNQQPVLPSVSMWRQVDVHREVDGPQDDSDRVEQLQPNQLFLQQILGERRRPVAVQIRDFLGTRTRFEEFGLRKDALRVVAAPHCDSRAPVMVLSSVYS